MLSRSIAISSNHAQYLAGKGVRLNPVAGSVLNDLVAESILSTGMSVNHSPETDGSGSNSQYAKPAISPVDVCDPWAHRFDGVLKDLVGLVSSQVNYIANNVKPAAVEFAEHLVVSKKMLEESIAFESKVEVVQFELPDIFQNSMFLHHLEKYSNQPSANIDPTLRSALGKVELNEVLSKVSFGSESMNEMFQNAIVSVYPELLQQFNNLIADTSVLPTDLNGSMCRVHDLPGNKRSLVLLGLFGSLLSLLENPSKEVKLSSAAYESLLNNALDNIAKELHYAISSLGEDIAEKRLVFGIYNSKVYVHSGVFNDWLKESGLSVEVLLGLAVSGMHLQGAEEVSQNAVELMKLWENVNELGERNTAREVTARMRNVVKALFIDSLREQDELEKEYHATYPNAHACMEKEANEFIDNVDGELLLDPFYMAKRLIAGIRFNYTEAEPFMCDMEEAAKDHQVDSNEASLIALVAYVSRYLSNMLVSEKVSSTSMA